MTTGARAHLFYLFENRRLASHVKPVYEARGPVSPCIGETTFNRPANPHNPGLDLLMTDHSQSLARAQGPILWNQNLSRRTVL